MANVFPRPIAFNPADLTISIVAGYLNAPYLIGGGTVMHPTEDLAYTLIRVQSTALPTINATRNGSPVSLTAVLEAGDVYRVDIPSSYTSAGNYGNTWVIEATNGFGTASSTFTMEPLNVAPSLFGPTGGVAGNNVVLVQNSGGVPVTVTGTLNGTPIPGITLPYSMYVDLTNDGDVLVVTATNTGGSSTHTQTLSITPATKNQTSPIAISSTDGETTTLTFNNTTPAVNALSLTLQSGTLPTGLSIVGNTITGTYSAVGSFSPVIRVTYPSNIFATDTVDLTIDFTVSAYVPPPALSGIASGSPLDTVTLVSNTGGPIVSASATLDGIAIPGFTIPYTVSLDTTYHGKLLSVTASNGTGTDTYSATLSVPPLAFSHAGTLTVADSGTVYVGASYNHSFANTGPSVTPVSVTLQSGSLPPGINISGGSITGTFSAYQPNYDTAYTGSLIVTYPPNIFTSSTLVVSTSFKVAAHQYVTEVPVVSLPSTVHAGKYLIGIVTPGSGSSLIQNSMVGTAVLDASYTGTTNYRVWRSPNRLTYANNGAAFALQATNDYGNSNVVSGNVAVTTIPCYPVANVVGLPTESLNIYYTNWNSSRQHFGVVIDNEELTTPTYVYPTSISINHSSPPSDGNTYVQGLPPGVTFSSSNGFVGSPTSGGGIWYWGVVTITYPPGYFDTSGNPFVITTYLRVYLYG